MQIQIWKALETGGNFVSLFFFGKIICLLATGRRPRSRNGDRYRTNTGGEMYLQNGAARRCAARRDRNNNFSIKTKKKNKNKNAPSATAISFKKTLHVRNIINKNICLGRVRGKSASFWLLRFFFFLFIRPSVFVILRAFRFLVKFLNILWLRSRRIHQIWRNTFISIVFRFSILPICFFT